MARDINALIQHPVVDNPTGETKVESVWAERLDLRAIAKRFGEQQPFDAEAMAEAGLVFGDQVAVDMSDFQAVAERVDARRRVFDLLPHDVRAAANHSAEEFGRMVHTSEGLLAIQEAGLPLGLEEAILSAPEPADPAAQPGPDDEPASEPTPPPSQPNEGSP
jgi:antitoxin component of MazEF toxin-antitoxin module